jgi:V-type H+-transporting ATPase subunit G
MATDDIDRTKRVKEARDEAKKEIEDYRKEKDEEFKKFESEVWIPALFPSFEPWILDMWICMDGAYAHIGYSTPAATKKQKKTQTRTPRTR